MSAQHTTPMACCCCNQTGTCRVCSCMKASRTCVSCLPGKLGSCLNSPTTHVPLQGTLHTTLISSSPSCLSEAHPDQLTHSYHVS